MEKILEFNIDRAFNKDSWLNKKNSKTYKDRAYVYSGL